MHIKLGSQVFSNVKIPILWGKRAILGHPDGELSIVDLAGDEAVPEIIASKPASKIEFSEQEDGFIVYKGDEASYFFSPPRKLIRDLTGALPECQIDEERLRVGTNTIQGGMISGFEVGVGITENGMFIGGPAPDNLAALII